MNDQLQTAAEALRVTGGDPPLMADLAALMPAAPELMDQLVSEYAATTARTLSTPQAYWTGLNGWMTDRLSGPVMDGMVTADEIGAQAWAIYATSCWGGMELREHWGMPPVIASMGDFAPKPPFEDVQQGVVVQMAQRMAAIRAGGEACLELLPSLLREAGTSSPVHGVAYNAGVQVVKTEDPPIGQRRPHRTPKPAAVRINGRDFMRVDYDMTTPQYLKECRSAFERAVTADPDAYELILAGGAGDTDLREIWKSAVEVGNTTWGGDSQDGWTDAYWEETIRWSSILTFGMEAAGLAAFAALINQDADAALRVVMCNALYLGATPGWFIGLLNTEAKLPQVTEAQVDFVDADENVHAWLERELDGTIVSFERQERWRAAWFADVSHDGEVHRYYVRGERGGNFREMITLEQEADVNRVLLRHGVPVPAVHGMIDDPPAIVMDRLPGRVNLATAVDDAERDAVLDDYIDAMRRMHAIDVEEFGAIGLRVPADNRGAALNQYRKGEANFRAAKSAPSPMIEFMWQWLQRNVPTGRDQSALIQADSAQFLYENGAMTGLIDFEAAYIGDPVAEFAAMRSRDCEEPLGDIGRIAAKYEAATGDQIDKNAVEFHTAGWSLMTPFQWEDSVRNPAPGDTWLEYFIWIVGCGRWALEAIAQVVGAPLEGVAPPDESASASYWDASYKNLMSILDEWPRGSDFDNFRADSARAVTRFAEHVHVFGRDLEAAAIDEISEIVGTRQSDLTSAEAALEEFVLSASPDRDAELVQYFHRWTQRQQFLIEGTGARHEKLIHISPQPLTGAAWK